MKKNFTILMVILFGISSLEAQDKLLGILGSSTAAGVGASVYDSSWVGRVDSFYRVTNNVINSTVNLAISGGTPYIAMPDGYVPPAGRPNPNVTHNITKIMTYNPDVLIISFVSNGYSSYSFAEIKFTLETIRNIALDAGKTVFVTTSQPRTDFGTAARQKLKDVKDSIVKWFGVFSINFYDSIVDPITLGIKAEYNSGDNIHLNDAGHAVLFRQVISKDIFELALPIRLQDFSVHQTGENKVSIQWTTNDDEENTSFILERSYNGKEFNPIAKVDGRNMPGNNSYKIEDRLPSNGKFYYRLKLTSGGISLYSSIQAITINNATPLLTVRGNPARENLLLEIYSPSSATGTVIIIGINGMILHQQSISLNTGSNSIRVNLDKIRNGQYIVRVAYKDRRLQAVFIKKN